MIVPGFYQPLGTIIVPSYPVAPEPGPGFVPPTIGSAGETWQVGVMDFPSHHLRGMLHQVTITDDVDAARDVGGNKLGITFPATAWNMRIMGDPKSIISRELFTASTVDGKIRRRYVVRDRWSVVKGRVTVQGVGIVGGIESDRSIGSPIRPNLLGDTLGSFENGLTGWSLIGNVRAGVEPGGPDGAMCAWVTGTPDGTNFIRCHAVATYPDPAPWGAVPVSDIAYVRLPEPGIDIDGFRLATISVYDAASGAQYYPPRVVAADQVADPGASKVNSSMIRGQWDPNPITATGFLPPPPFRVDVCVDLHPTDETRRTYYDGNRLSGQENTSTVYPVDLIRHVEHLWNHAESDPNKASMGGIKVVLGVPSGIVEQGVWWHNEGPTLPSAFDAVLQRGVEMWDYPEAGWAVKASKRQGDIRHDLMIHEWDLLGDVGWQVDPRQMRSALRARSAIAATWSGADEGAIDISRTGGQVIDGSTQGPTGFTPTQLRAWVREQLGLAAKPQLTASFQVRWSFGQRFRVGDSAPVAVSSMAAELSDWVRVHTIHRHHESRTMTLDVGLDPTMGG